MSCALCCMCTVAGLVVASVMVDLTGAAQPALLYLVPGALLPLLLKASLQVSPFTVHSIVQCSTVQCSAV